MILRSLLVLSLVLAPGVAFAHGEPGLVAFFVLSLVAGYRLALRAFPDARAAARGYVPLAVLSALFTIAGIVPLNLPMSMRHGM